MHRRRSWRVAAALALSGGWLAATAQPPPGPPPAARSARDAARVDLTGNWVAQITEDWRWRMVTPPKGDYASVPLNPAGRRAADGWDLARDAANGEACRAFGAAGLLRLPTRLKISWADADTLKIESDAGEQTRLLHFAPVPPPAERSWQGHSQAEWLGTPPPAGPFGFGPPPPAPAPAPPADSRTRAAGRRAPPATDAPPPRPADPSVKVVTTHLKAGYLRKNGVPYSENATVTEYFDRLTMFGNDYLQVVTIVDDPTYLTTPYFVSNHFKREPDDSKWNPTPCQTDEPFGAFNPSPFVP